jgi:hypothetical protein
MLKTWVGLMDMVATAYCFYMMKIRHLMLPNALLM